MNSGCLLHLKKGSKNVNWEEKEMQRVGDGVLERECKTFLRKSSGQEGKLLYASRATLGHRFQEFLKNSVR